jgi:hypothetical protein
MNRRGFLGTILACGTAPAIVRADSLMRIVPRSTTILITDTYRDGKLVSSEFKNITDWFERSGAKMKITGRDQHGIPIESEMVYRNGQWMSDQLMGVVDSLSWSPK